MSSQAIMLKQLDKNENSAIMKEAINKVTKLVVQRVYWLNTSQMEGDFLQQYWQNQVTANDIMKKRIVQITQQKFNQLFAEINRKKVTPMHGLEVFTIQNLNLSQLTQQLPILDHHYWDQNHPRTLQTKAKLKQIKQDHLKFKEKIQQLKKKQQQRRLQKYALDEQIRRSLQKQKKQKYRQNVMKTIQQKNHKKQQRKQENQKFKQFLKVYKNTKPLHLLMEQQFKQKVQLPMLQQNRRKLQQYKENTVKVKPSLQEINDHQKSYLQAKNGRQSRLVVANQTIDVFKSKFYIEQQRKLREGNDEYETLFDQVQKKKRYSELVKQNFKPKISISLRKSINQSQLKSSTARQSLDRTALNQKGKQYLEFMRSLQKNRRQHSSPSQKNQKQESHRYINYLQSLKQSHQVQGNNPKIYQDWQKELNSKNLSQFEKRQRILMKSKQLDQKAHRKQLFINNHHFGKAQQIIQKKKQVDQTLISSIRAKVAILRDAQKI